MAALGKSRAATGQITDELEERIQGLLDAIGPGRSIEAESPDNPAPRPDVAIKG